MFDHVVVNDNLDQAYLNLKAVVTLVREDELAIVQNTCNSGLVPMLYSTCEKLLRMMTFNPHKISKGCRAQ